MPSTQTSPAAARGGAASAHALLEWRVHLAARERRKARVVVALVLVAMFVAAVAFSHPLAPLLTAVALLASVSEFLFPLTYRLTAEGVEQHNALSHHFLAWKDVRRCEAAEEGVRLSPLPVPSFRDNYRSIILRLPEENEARAQFVETLWAHCPQGVLHFDPLQEGRDAADRAES